MPDIRDRLVQTMLDGQESLGVTDAFLAFLADPENRDDLFAAMGFPVIRPWYKGGFLVSPKAPDA